MYWRRMIAIASMMICIWWATFRMVTRRLPVIIWIRWVMWTTLMWMIILVAIIMTTWTTIIISIRRIVIPRPVSIWVAVVMTMGARMSTTRMWMAITTTIRRMIVSVIRCVIMSGTWVTAWVRIAVRIWIAIWTRVTVWIWVAVWTRVTVWIWVAVWTRITVWIWITVRIWIAIWTRVTVWTRIAVWIWVTIWVRIAVWI